MSDALCGPSNPLQQFKQQTQLDRTLQQDRLSTRHAPAQGFRSHDPHAGLLDPEFEAFQAGLPLPDLPLPQFRAPNLAGPSQAPSWAADFSRMHISPSPQSFQQSLPRAAPMTGSWAQGFREQIVQDAPRAQTSPHSPQAFQHMARYGMNSFQPSFSQPMIAQNVRSKGKEPAVEQFDDAAFERAFDQASRDMMTETDTAEAPVAAYDTGASTADFDVDHETHLDAQTKSTLQDRDVSHAVEAHALEDAVRMDTLERLADEPLLDQDTTMVEENQEADEKQADEDDALAATARELLEKVEHNQTVKFKNSQFLNLMRKLRDREMKVEGDQMVETAAASTASTSTQNLLDTTDIKHIATEIPKFDNSEQTPYPLGPINSTLVDTRPLDYDTARSSAIPRQEQDHDAGRIDPRDGQEVVDYLNRRNASPDDIGTPAFGPKRSPAKIGKTGWATPSWASGYYFPKDMEPEALTGLS